MSTSSGATPGERPGGNVRDLLASGQRLEFAGVPTRALRTYLTAAALADTPALRAEATRRVGDAHRARGAWTEARAAYAESLAIAEGHGLGELAAEALNAEAMVAFMQGEVAHAESLFRSGLQREPSARVRGMLLQNLGMCALRHRDRSRAEALFDQALECFRESGYRRGQLMALNNLGALHIEYGDPADALPLLHTAAGIARELLDVDLLLLTVRNEAEVCAKLGRLTDAERHIGEAIGHFTTAGNERRLAECLIILGDIQRAYATEEKDAVAARCYERAETLAAAAGVGELVERARQALAAAHASRAPTAAAS